MARRFLWLALGLVACSAAPSSTPPPPRPSASAAPVVTSAPSPSDEPVLGAPVLVSQLLRESTAHASLSSDGKLVVIPGPLGVQVLDAETGQVRGVHHGCSANGALVSGSSHYVASGCAVGEGYLWDLATDRTIPLALSSARGAVVVAPEAPFAIITSDRAADWVDVQATKTSPLEIKGAPGWNFAVASSASAIALVADKEAWVFASPTQPPFVERHATRLSSVALSRTGKLVALSSSKGTTRVLDVASRRTLGDKELCPGALDVAFTDAEDALLVACPRKDKRARILSFSPDLSRETLIFEGDRENLQLTTLGARVAVSSASGGLTVLEVATGKKLWEVHVQARSFSLDDKMQRALAVGSRVEDLTLYDQARGKLPWSLAHDSSPFVLERAAGGLLGLRIGSDRRVYDATSWAELPPTELGLDGHHWIRLTQTSGLDAVPKPTATFVEQTTKSEVTVALPEKGESVATPGGTRVVTRVASPGSGPQGWALVVTTPKQPVRKLALDASELSFEVSADDRRLAYVVDTHVFNGHPCSDAMTRGCLGVRVYDLVNGAPLGLVHEAPDWRSLSDFALSPDGTTLRMGRTFYDATTGKALWKRPEGTTFLGFLRHRSLALVAEGEVTRVLAAADGKEIGRFQRLEALVGSSDDDARLVGVALGKLVLVDTASFAVTPVPLDAPPKGSLVWVSPDGAFLWTVEVPYVVAYRVKDGERLDWSPGAAPITGRGVLDPADVAKLPFLVRSGPHVARSPLLPLSTWVKEHGHPKLVEDFFAGRSVAPAP